MNSKRLLKRTTATLLMSMFFLISFAQNRTVTGVVLDNRGDPVIGANIKVVGNEATGTITDLDGKFSLTASAEARRLEISFIGMQTQVVDMVSGQLMQITLQEDAEQLDEVVVIGYQTVRRRDLTGSVASVNGQTIAAAPVANVAQALQGKLPGVNVISQDGRPDAEISIRVRGGGSISQSNDPLVLIDGVVGSLNDIPADMVESIDVLKDASSTAIYGARGANGVILVTTKGAKEGKISVTYNGYAKFNSPAKYMKALDPYDYLAYKWAVADAYDPTGSYRVPFEKLYGIGNYATSENGGIESYRNVPKYDMQKEVYNDSFSHNHDITITGGTESTKVLFSVNYMDEQGMKLNSYYKRANVSLKVNQKIFKNLDISLDTRYTDTEKMNEEGTTNGVGSTLSSAYRFRPIATEHIRGDLDALQDGGYIDSYGKFSQWDSRSPVNILNDREPLKLSQNLRATLSLNWQIIKGLTYHTDLTLSRSWSEDRLWTGPTPSSENDRSYLDDANPGEIFYAGDIDYQKSNKWNMRWTNTLNYDLSFWNIHKLNFLLGQEVADSGGSDLRVIATRFPSNFTKDNAFAMISQYDQTNGTVNLRSGISTPTRILSYFGRVNYSLLDRYLMTFTFRADGSSKFSPEHRWGYFPAAALAWRVSEEAFMKDINWLDNLKFRASYGQVGSDGINSDKWAQTWSAESDERWLHAINNQYYSSYTLSSKQMANKDLKWETTITRNLGLDFGILQNRLWGTVDVYWNTTKDLLMLTTLPGITSFTSTYTNIGQTSNKGLELSLSGVVFKNKDWNITANANINFNKNNVDKLSDSVTGLYGTQWISRSNPSDDYILQVGSPVGMVRGLVYEGIYTTADFNYENGVYTLKAGIPDISSSLMPTFLGIGANERPTGQMAYPGMPKFKNLDGNDVIDADDYTIIGNMNPKHTGGFSINANYKNIDLGLYFNWSYGNKIYNVNKLATLYGAGRGGVYENKLDIVKDSYKIYDIVDGQLVRMNTPAELDALNTHATLPLAYNETGLVSSLGIEDGSYLRLNTLTLGYTFPKEWTRKVSINNLRVYGTVYNLFTLTGYSGLDPEVNANANLNHAVYPTTGMDWGTYPRARSFVIGLNLNF